MKQTAVEWLADFFESGVTSCEEWAQAKEQAKEMEKKEKLKHQLFIGKVTDVIGFDKTLELLRECNNTVL